MKTLKLTCLLIMVVLGVASVSAQDDKPETVITLARTACFGSCPVYTVSILADGTVLYNGENFVEVTGEQTGLIEPESLAVLVKAFEDAGYADWDEAYDTMTITDQPTITTSFTQDGKIHQIVRYAGDESAPLELQFLELLVDEIVNTQLWTGVQPNLTSVSNGMDTPILTLQRGVCFGFCPTYSIAAFEDGTIVYTGIANVDNLGVHIFKADGAVVTSVAQRAGIFGYFNWQESYEEHLMTDQPTVISSVRTEEGFKRIVRYDGDPNAPIGLIRIEAAIDQLIVGLEE